MVVAAIVVAVETVITLSIAGTDVDGLATALRVTARSTFVLFLMAFAASASVTLWGSQWAKWLLRNRKHLGLSAALSHGVHAILIVWNAVERDLNPVTRFFQAALPGYIAFLVLAITSIKSVRSGIGARRWKRLHRGGMYIIWIVFVNAYVRSAIDDAFFIVPAVAALGVGLIRMLAWQKRRARQARRAVA